MHRFSNYFSNIVRNNLTKNSRLIMPGIHVSTNINILTIAKFYHLHLEMSVHEHHVNTLIL